MEIKIERAKTLKEKPNQDNLGFGNYFTDHGTDLCKSDGTFPAISVSGIFAGRSADVRNHSDVDFRLYPDNGGFADPVSAVSETDGGSQRRFG